MNRLEHGLPLPAVHFLLQEAGLNIRTPGEGGGLRVNISTAGEIPILRVNTSTEGSRSTSMCTNLNASLRGRASAEACPPAVWVAGGLNFNARLARFSGQHAYVDESILQIYPVSAMIVTLRVTGPPGVPQNVSYANAESVSLKAQPCTNRWIKAVRAAEGCAVYQAFKSELFQLVNEPPSDQAMAGQPFWLQWIELTSWNYTQPTGQLDMTLTLFASQCLPSFLPVSPQCQVDPPSAVERYLQQANVTQVLGTATGQTFSNSTVAVAARMVHLHVIHHQTLDSHGSPRALADSHHVWSADARGMEPIGAGIATVAHRCPRVRFPAGNQYVSPANGTAWHLDRLDQRRLPLDGENTCSRACTAPNTGEGVNIYLLSSGVLGTHEEFWDPVRKASRVMPLWGVGVVVMTST
eukprot:jgi/Botrbrau1/18724/Bobra.0386s0047.1